MSVIEQWRSEPPGAVERGLRGSLAAAPLTYPMVSRPEMARHAAEIAQLHARIDQLETALVSRATIDQAKGMLMAFAGWAADEAFAELAGVSQDTNVKLALIAGRLVDDVTARRVARRDQQSVRQILRALAAEVDGN